MALLTLQQAIDHLQLPQTDFGLSPVSAVERDLTLKLAAAEAIILDYVNSSAAGQAFTATWTDETTVPANVRAAILLQLAELYRFRGDDADGPTHTEGQLSVVVTNLLRRYRDPALA